MKIRILAVVFATIAFVAISTANTQPVNYFYETLIVGNAGFPCVNAVGVLSAWEEYHPNPPIGPSGYFGGVLGNPGGIFADFHTSAWPASAIHAAALDSNTANAVPGVFYPTGSLSVAKNVGAINCIETYMEIPGSPVNPTDGTLINSQELISQAGPVSYIIQTASLNQVQAMDIANGYIPAGVSPMVTDYIVTAESLIGFNTIWLGAYGLTNPLNGMPCMPYLANAFPTGQPGPCQGLTTSNGKAGVSPRSRNDIVFVDAQNIAHAEYFEISSAAFWPWLDTNTMFPAVPCQLPAGAIAGVWICQTPWPVANAHNVGISISAAPNQFWILNDLSNPSPLTTVVGFGGGPLCHVPTGYNRPWNRSSPAYWALLGGAPRGWYVVDDQTAGPAGVFILEAIDANGARPGAYVYPFAQGCWPNGSPLSDPCAIGFNRVATHERGLVWIPMTNGVLSWIELSRGAVNPLAVGLRVTTFNHAIGAPAGANHPPLPPLPIPINTPWPCNQILQDQKTNSKADYGLFIPGF